jgi:peptidoglycan/LPS O-acetylase OafA/YrhL
MAANPGARWPHSLLDTVTGQLSRGYTRLRNEFTEVGDDLTLSEKQSQSTFLSQLGWCLVPSYISRLYGHCDVESPKPNATSYLNGLRGIAATVVVVLHSTSEYFWFVNVAYVATPPNNRLIQLPFIRVLMSGHFMVAIFFVLSGFVLSYGPLRKVYDDNSSGAIAGLPGSVVRRPIRLFLPALPSFLFTAIATYMQIFWMDFAVAYHPSKGGLWADLSEAMHQWTALAWSPYRTEHIHPPLNPVCWTLGMEFQGSIVVFLIVLATARMAPWLRMTLTGMCAWDAFYHNPQRWFLTLFLVGMILADMRHVRTHMPPVPRIFQRLVRIGSFSLLFLSLFFGGWPPIDAEKGMWYSSFAGWPDYGHRFSGVNFYWASIAAIMLMIALENLPDLHGFFNHPICLYLGEISFSLYLSHYFVLHTVGKRLIYGLRLSGSSHVESWLIGTSITMVVIFVVADVYWRLVDLKSIKFARWVVEQMGV